MYSFKGVSKLTFRMFSSSFFWKTLKGIFQLLRSYLFLPVFLNDLLEAAVHTCLEDMLFRKRAVQSSS